MKILLTNDDGINSPGIRSLHAELIKIAEVWVVAPETEQSAVGHAITISDPIRVKEIHNNNVFFGYSVTGTPADCVKIAVNSLMDTPPDMVVSGINIGANVSINIIYSGTVSAATEGTILGFPSIAVSLDTFMEPLFDAAVNFMREFTPFVYRQGLPPGTSLNVNVPNLPREKIKGVEITQIGNSRFREEFYKRTDPRGNVYYWQGGEMVFEEVDNKNSDSNALRNGIISVTPIHYDLTDHSFFEKMQGEDWRFDWK